MHISTEIHIHADQKAKFILVFRVLKNAKLIIWSNKE